MSRLPVIVAQGGVSPAGRSSGFHGYRRLVVDRLGAVERQQTLNAIARLRGLDNTVTEQDILSGTLIRQLEDNLFDADNLYLHNALNVQEGSELILPVRRLPALPEGWVTEPLADGKHVRVRVTATHKMMLPGSRVSPVKAAGQLPSGFQPEKLYQSRHHPRSLAMTVFGASDAVLSSGLDWAGLKGLLAPEEMAVYSGSAMSQLDYNGNGGMMQARLLGKRVTSKQCPLGFSEMSADFINAYILGSLGATGTSMGACATMLYNLQLAVNDIRSGRRRLVVVGNSEAPVTPEIMDGYTTMGALATDADLRGLDQLMDSEDPDWRRACRPFADNAGFTIAESSQFLILMDDELAMEAGAEVLGAVADVFVNADGYKKSISAPGAGNYLTVARAAALGRSILGEEALRQRSYVQAHGTGTPQNRVTESHILNETAKVFGIDQWAVSAVKSYVGHSIGVAGGDQIMSTLGVWDQGIIPGIRTINHLAEDVHASHLNILTDHHDAGVNGIDMTLVNAKGFGGNNATALIMSPDVVLSMMQKKHGEKATTAWEHRQENTRERQQEYEDQYQQGTMTPIYQFGQGVLNGDELDYTDQKLSVPGYGRAMNLNLENPYW
ncbi:beta-ketoacyl synthase [Endozoicomonas gorgoniicola]|uniref:Beta-ketoacyl synthase n=1 Tax=Endozoicomonas gorgoniicola TaxID=1234144 RepID=A0ABT3MSK5_9GAMM|nr:beta-ketoacyl synthase [Endozoicomonas gorgoniicola]MCW7552367.1 beta-ketoacyl synthase [Endozoicomonas gorgoniicola]